MRGLAFSRGLSREQIFDTDVFVEVWLVNSVAFADEPPVVALCCGSVQQAWIPCQGRGNDSAVTQFER
jgi:hypothetical protein